METVLDMTDAMVAELLMLLGADDRGEYAVPCTMGKGMTMKRLHELGLVNRTQVPSARDRGATRTLFSLTPEGRSEAALQRAMKRGLVLGPERRRA